MKNVNKNNSRNSSGVGFTGLLTIAFIVLKILGYIDWSWVWVLSPIWINFIVAVIILIIGAVYIKIRKK